MFDFKLHLDTFWSHKTWDIEITEELIKDVLEYQSNFGDELLHEIGVRLCYV